LVHQSVAVLPHWLVEADQHGRWTVTMQLALDTSRAQSRYDRQPLEAATV
jgi:alpha-amylase